MKKKNRFTYDRQIEVEERDRVYSKMILGIISSKFRFIKAYKIQLMYAGITISSVFFILLVFSNLYILRYKKYIVSPFDIPTSTYGIVFGGGVKDKKLPAMAMDRMIEGVALYKTGKIEKLMITGDDGAFRGDEVNVMGKIALEYGMPKDKVFVDPHGYRTYESCYREAKIYGVKRAVVISQSFHLPRIIYLCRNFGIETVGVAADLQGYGSSSWYMDIREISARLKAWWQVVISKPPPRDMSKK